MKGIATQVRSVKAAINIRQAKIDETFQKSGRLRRSSTFGEIHRIAKQYPAHLVSAALLVVMAVNLLSVMGRKSITIDETLIIPSGYYYLNSRTFFIEPDHPPLSKILAGLPLVFLPLQTPELGDLTSDTTDEQTLVAADRFWTTNRQHFESVFFWSRVPMVILTLLSGALVFSFARRLFAGPEQSTNFRWWDSQNRQPTCSVGRT